MSITAFFSIIIVSLVIFLSLFLYFFTKKQFLYGWLFSIFFLVSAVFLGFNYFIIFHSNKNVSTHSGVKTFTITKGSPLSQIASDLKNDNLISDKDYFIWSIGILGLDNRIKAGKYMIEPGISNYDLIIQLTSGDVIREKVTIAEGLTSKQIAGIYSGKLEIDTTKFIRLVNDREFAEKLGINQNSLEGYLYPNTYFFTWGVSEKEIIETMVNEFRKTVTEDIVRSAEKLNLNLHQLVTLASIIEGEAVHDEEREKISAVFNNRLKKGWKLQADPTIQYIIPDGPRRLLNDDLEIDSPYNTYRYRGLPPGPINNPGIKSIYAAANPSGDAFMYFVATGEGYHTFTVTQKEHLEAKRILDKLRKEIKKNSPEK